MSVVKQPGTVRQQAESSSCRQEDFAGRG